MKLARHAEQRTALPVPLGCSAKHLHYVGSFNQGALTEHFPRLTFCRCTLKAPKTILRFKSDPSRPYQAARLKPCGAQDDGLAIILHFALCILHCAAARSAQDDGLITILHFAFCSLHCALRSRFAPNPSLPFSRTDWDKFQKLQFSATFHISSVLCTRRVVD